VIQKNIGGVIPVERVLEALIGSQIVSDKEDIHVEHSMQALGPIPIGLVYFSDDLVELILIGPI
jgi:hypothetical protein